MIHWQPGISLADVERQVILMAYRFYGEHRAKTADGLKISIKTLYNRLKEYGVKDDGQYQEFRIQEDSKIDPGPLPQSHSTKAGDGLESAEKMAQESTVSVRKRGKV